MHVHMKPHQLLPFDAPTPIGAADVMFVILPISGVLSREPCAWPRHGLALCSLPPVRIEQQFVCEDIGVAVPILSIQCAVVARLGFANGEVVGETNVALNEG